MQAGRAFRVALGLLMVAASACSTQSVTQPSAGSAPLLSPPSALRQGSDELKSACYLAGCQYQRGWPHRQAFTSDADDRLSLTGEPEGGYAYACYLLGVPACQFDEAVHVAIDGGIPVGEVWLGIGDAGCDCWCWRLLDGSATAQLEPSRQVVGGACSVVLMYTGTATLKVDSIWLGAATPPFIEDVLPRVGTGGSTHRFSIQTASGGKPLSCAWEFGEAAEPSASCQCEPLVRLQEPGQYDCSVTVANCAGSCTEHFTLGVEESSQYLPGTLYAIPAQTSAETGGTVTVRVVTGQLPADAPLRTVYTVGLTVGSGCDYVAGSFNAGAPGGAAADVDGVWSTLSSAPQGFMEINEDYVGPLPTDVPGQQLLIFNVVPINGGVTTAAGDLFNFRLRFSAPGDYQLGFRDYYLYERTYYADDELRIRRWDDISNDHPEHAHRIVVAD